MLQAGVRGLVQGRGSASGKVVADRWAYETSLRSNDLSNLREPGGPVGKRRDNGNGVVGGRFDDRSPLRKSGALAHLDFLSVVAVGIASVGPRVAMLLAARVPGMVPAVAHGPGLHVAGESSAECTGEGQTHLDHHRLSAALHSPLWYRKRRKGCNGSNGIHWKCPQ